MVKEYERPIAEEVDLRVADLRRNENTISMDRLTVALTAYIGRDSNRGKKPFRRIARRI